MLKPQSFQGFLPPRAQEKIDQNSRKYQYIVTYWVKAVNIRNRPLGQED
jgi:hypothetical protein